MVLPFPKSPKYAPPVCFPLKYHRMPTIPRRKPGILYGPTRRPDPQSHFHPSVRRLSFKHSLRPFTSHQRWIIQNGHRPIAKKCYIYITTYSA
ncbi:hypothetical protein OF83DRAFT_391108 [Amylostereum chailletii]|nr:hypothetical protein OF83DRAFT_391108 [Amylostereum chailletii]